MRELFQLVLPVVATYLGINLMGLVDLIFVGKTDAASIGAVGFSSVLFTWVLVFGLGIVSGLDFLVSRAFGANKKHQLPYFLGQGILLSTWVSIPLTLILALVSKKLSWFGINSEVIPMAQKYILILSLSLYPACLFNVLRLYLTAQGVASPALLVLVLGNLLNAGIDYALVLGGWGFPSLGAIGSAWATLISRVMMVLGLAVYLYWRDQRTHRIIQGINFKYHPRVMKDLLRLGIPSALQMVFEVGVFALGTTLAARLTAADLAAHQIVLHIANITFMVPLGIGAATAVLVGQALGRKDLPDAARAGWKGFALGGGFMALSCAFLLIFADWILLQFTHDSQIRNVGHGIFLVAALFQLSDGIQTVGTGALRGLGDTRNPMFYNLCGHWLLGLPVGVLLGFHLGWGLRGIWIGLSMGLTVVAAGVAFQWWKQVREF